jgi:VWFA-related protein
MKEYFSPRVGLVIAWLSLGLGMAAQAPQFKTGVDLVTLDVTVLDKSGKPVTDLTRDDFIVLENGKPQSIGSFAAVHSPVVTEAKAVWTKSAPVDIAVNDLPEQRLLVLVVDDATLPFDPAMLKTAKAAARAFIEGLGPTDRVAVVFTRNNRNAQDFTYDKSRLLAAVDRTTTGNLGAGYSAIPNALPVAGPVGKASDLYYYLSSVGTLARVSEYLEAVPLRKKAIVWLSVGVPLDTDALGDIVLSVHGGPTMADTEAERAIMIAMRRAIDRAQRANVAIYGLSPAGLDGIRNYNFAHPRSPLPPERQFTEFLQAMASNTGGRAFINTNDLLPAVAQVLNETSSYYLIGYSPNPRGDAGSYRRVEVKTTRPGLTIRTRSGYYVTPPEAQPAENVPLGLSAIKGVLPDSGIRLRGIAAPFAQSNGRTALAMTVSVDSESLPEGAAGDVSIVTRVFDPEGREEASFNQQARLCSQPGWCDISFVLPTTPGRHAVRIGIEHRPTGQSGSVYLDAVVPDFSRRGTWLSGLALEITPAAPRAFDAAVRALLPVLPTTRREITTADRASVFFRVHQGGDHPLTEVLRTFRITDESDIRIVDRSERIDASAFGAGRVADQRLDVPAGTLKPGRYLLSVEVRAPNSPGSTESRQLVFTVK